MNKNYSINKGKHKPKFCISNYSNYSSKKMKYNNNYKINNNISENLYNKNNNESFNEINRGNISYYNSSGKNKINRKKRFIMNQNQNDFKNIIDNLKYKSVNGLKSKNISINNNINNNSICKKQNQIEIKNTISTEGENNKNNFSYNSNKTNNNIQNNIIGGIGKSLSCKHMNNNYCSNQKYKNNSLKFSLGHKNIYKKLNKSLDKKLNKLKEKNNKINKYYYNDDKLYDIINEYFIKYCNFLDNQSQKELIVNIFYQMNDLLNKREKDLIILQRERENFINKNKIYKKKNEDLSEQNKILINKNNILQNQIDELNSELNLYKKNKKENNNLKNKIGKNLKINNIDNVDIQSNDLSFNNNNEDKDEKQSSSSFVNSEELESIRFFDKIKMKKNSFSNIPELSFHKIKIDETKNNNYPIKKKNKNKLSFQGKNKLIKKENNNLKENNINFIIKNNYNNSNILQKYKQKLNSSFKINENSSANKMKLYIFNNNKYNKIDYLYIPDLKKNVSKKKIK